MCITSLTGKCYPPAVVQRLKALRGGPFYHSISANSVKLLLYKIWIDILRRFVILNICSKMLQKGPVAP